MPSDQAPLLLIDRRRPAPTEPERVPDILESAYPEMKSILMITYSPTYTKFLKVKFAFILFHSFIPFIAAKDKHPALPTELENEALPTWLLAPSMLT